MYESVEASLILQYRLDSLTYRVDDIIKAVTALHLGQSYKTTDGAETEAYGFASNCVILLGLIQSAKPALYSEQIKRCVQLICDEWWSSDAPLMDKVNEL